MPLNRRWIILAIIASLFLRGMVLITIDSGMNRFALRGGEQVYRTVIRYCELHGEFQETVRLTIFPDVPEIIISTPTHLYYDLGICLDYLETLSVFDHRVLVAYRQQIFFGDPYIPWEDIPYVVNIPAAGECICPQ